MNFNNLMIITAIATICFGTGFIIALKALIALYGLSSTPPAINNFPSVNQNSFYTKG